MDVWKFRIVTVLVLVLGVLLSQGVKATENILDVSIGDVYFGVHDAYLLKVQVTNNNTEASNLTLSLDPLGGVAGPGAPKPYDAELLDAPGAILSADKQQLNITNILPNETRIFYVEVKSLGISGESEMQITGNIEGGGNETLGVIIHGGELYNFPGLELPGILILVFFASLLYWKITKY